MNDQVLASSTTLGMCRPRRRNRLVHARIGNPASAFRKMLLAPRIHQEHNNPSWLCWHLGRVLQFSSRSRHQWFSRFSVYRRVFFCSWPRWLTWTDADHSQLAEFRFSGGTIVAASRLFWGQGKCPTCLFDRPPAPTSTSSLPRDEHHLESRSLDNSVPCCQRCSSRSDVLHCARWTRWLLGQTSVTAACRSFT